MSKIKDNEQVALHLLAHHITSTSKLMKDLCYRGDPNLCPLVHHFVLRLAGNEYESLAQFTQFHNRSRT